MLVNRWLVIDSIDGLEYGNERAGLCFYLSREPHNIASLLRFAQEQSTKTPFAVLLSGDDLDSKKPEDSYIEKIIGLFFQPSYYLVNYRPLVFLTKRTQACSHFFEKLKNSCKKQGLQDILTLETEILDHVNRAFNQFSYLIIDGDINYSLLVKNWLTQHLDNKNPTEIHFLIPSKNKKTPEILNEMLKKEHELQQTADYRIANALYQKQKMIEEYKHELFLKTNSEKDTQLYLSIQKEERANGLKWYYYEYEILPTWYKRLGHIVKVLMGKRTFRSLFSDKVKKYKD